MDAKLLAVIQGLIRQGDELHAQHVAELERTVAGLHGVLRDLANAGMRLTEFTPPSTPSDAAVIEDVVRRASRVLDYLEPSRH